MVSPQKMVSDVLTRYARALQNSLGSNVETLYKIMDGKAEALEFNVQSDFKFLEIPLKDMKLKPNILIAGIIRGRKTIIPAGNDVIHAEDRVIVLSTEHRLHDLSDIMA
jgi:trk system potassium uptake protein TrkA